MKRQTGAAFADALLLDFSSDENVTLVSEQGHCAISLRCYSSLVRRLDGTQSLRDFREALATNADQADTLEALDRLAESGAITQPGTESGATDPTERSSGPARESHLIRQRLGAYRIIRRIGAGGFGEVYEAIDTERGGTVALKALPDVDPETLMDFKEEVRVVCDLGHPNLLIPFEMLVDHGHWCFTMELIDGLDFVEHVRASPDDARRSDPWSTDREARLRGALGQLASAVEVLHRNNLLHLDIKPGNVLVRRDSHLFVLDFGLIQRLAPGASDRRVFAGTLDYMSPERLMGEEASTASDWYAVGVMLFQALTGRLPFESMRSGSVLSSTFSVAPKASDLCPVIPRDLEELCAGLLERNPQNRLGGVEVAKASRQTASPSDFALGAGKFVGRQSELEVLGTSYRQSQAGETTCVFVSGTPGIGKSTMIRRFLDELTEELPRPIILAGRCYERESMPYKGFDTIVDCLRDRLASMPIPQQVEFVDADDADAAEIFSVLGTLEAFKRLPRRASTALADYERREMAFLGVKRIIGRLARRFGAVLFLDDVQWGDADTVRLLLQVISPPDPPPLLLICSYRRDEEARSEFLKHWKSTRHHHGLTFTQILLGPLAPADAQSLCTDLLHSQSVTATVAAIAEHSGGDPFLIGWLTQQASMQSVTQHTQNGGGIESADQSERPGLSCLELSTAFDSGLKDLPDVARRYLEVLAIAGGPIGQSAAASAAEAGTAEREVLSVLRSRRLIRTGGARRNDTVETYHDRIRDIVAGRLAPSQRQQLHLRVGTVLETAGSGNPGVLAWHFHEGGRVDAAIGYARATGDEARRALAFDRAAKYYGLAVAWEPGGSEPQLELLVLQAEALANAGRGPEAAPVFLRAALKAPEAQAWDLRRSAVEQQLVSGQVEAGTAGLRHLAADSGLGFPSSIASTLLFTLAQLAALRLRRPSAAPVYNAVSAEPVLRQIDLASTAFKGLMPVDPPRAGYYALKALRLSLKVGDRSRTAISLARVGAGVLAPAGPMFSAWGTRLLREAEAHAAKLKDPYLNGSIEVTQAAAAFWEGAWEKALTRCENAVTTLTGGTTGAAYESNMTRLVAIRSLEELGRWHEAHDRNCEMYRDALERGDLYAEVTACLNHGFWHLTQGDTKGAKKWADQTLLRWATEGCHVQHVYSLRIRLYADLYDGDGPKAWAQLIEKWPEIRKNMHLQILAGRVDLQLLRGRIALSCAAGSSSDRARFVAEARRCAKDLEKVQRPDGPGHAAQLLAGAAYLDSDLAAARRHLQTAATKYRAADMEGYALCAELRLADLANNEDDARQDQLTSALRGQGIAEPREWLQLYAPGFSQAMRSSRLAKTEA